MSDHVPASVPPPIPPESTPTRTPPAEAPAVRAAKHAVSWVFVGSGFGFASWASRIPQIRDALQASPSVLGLVLLSVAVGSIIALPLAGLVVTRIGPARAVTVMSLVLTVGLIVLALGYRTGIPATALGLFLIGFGNGTWDVAMNVEGAAVEQRLRRAIMPKFHAGFSIGTVGGALGGALMVALGVPVTAHLIGVAVVIAIGMPWATRSFLPAEPAEHAVDEAPRANPLTAWTEPRTLLVGVFVLCLAFTEGTGNDWLAIAVIDGYGAPPVMGPLTLALFLAAMTSGRWFGPALIDRFGRVKVLRLTAGIALAGLLLLIFGTFLPIAMIGAVLLGVGASLGFPVGMSAAADDPARSAARVSVVASIGYTAFLAGPPLIGFLGDHVGVLRALTVTSFLLALALLLAGVTRPLEPEPTRSEEPDLR